MPSAIPQNSIVLVTGCNGFVATHMVDQILKAGYRVRGTTRDLAKVQNLKTLWDETYGAGKFEAVVVSDMSADGAFDEAVKGVSGIAHVASNVSFSTDPNKVIPEVCAGIQSILKSAASEPSVKRFVLTSSANAATAANPNIKHHVDSTTWNEAELALAWAPNPTPFNIYGASKAAGEKALWKFVAEQKPNFVVNTVLPYTCIGKLFDPKALTSTAAMVVDLYHGKKQNTPPQWFVNVDDCALLHLACLTNVDVKNERIFAWAGTYTWNTILRSMRKLRPDAKIIDDYVDDSIQDQTTVSNERAVELLKELGRPGWTSLDDSVESNLEGF